MNKVTIKDVAKEAGVSISTVSNALNGVDVLNPATKEHILEVANRLHYVPNLNGRNLKATSTKAIGLFVSSMRGDFYGALADSMYWELQKSGYELYVYITNKNETILSNILGRRVDGAVILYEGVKKEAEEELLKSGVPVIFLDREVMGKNVSSLVFDSYHMGELAGQYLIQRGYKSFGHIFGVRDNYDSMQRYSGFVHALRIGGYTILPEHIWDGGFDRMQAYSTMDNYLSQGNTLPEAIFAANDLSAIGCMKALKAHGIKVPNDVGIIGCDGIELSELVHPTLTTVQTSFEKLGVIAAQNILDLIQGKTSGMIEKLGGTIVKRSSC